MGGEQCILIQRSHNSHGRFVKVIEYGTGSGKGIIVNPKGCKGSGRVCFVEKLRVLVGKKYPTSGYVNRGTSTGVRNLSNTEVMRW